MKAGDRVQLPDSAPTRKNAKPKQRYAIVLESPFNLVGMLFVEKCDRAGQWWVKENICKEL